MNASYLKPIVLAPYQTYDKSCGGPNCDSSKGLVCRDINKVKTCRCPPGNWFWYNNAQCRMYINGRKAFESHASLFN